MGGLPEGWTRAPLDDLLEPNGLFDGPFGSNLKTSDYTTSGIRVIRLENIANLHFDAEKYTYISPEKYAGLTKHTVRENDIVVGSFVDGAVRVCVLPKLATKAIAKADCFCVRTRMELADRHFVAYQLGTNQIRDELTEHIHGATRPRITTRQLRELPVLLPPIAEQRRIVDKVEALLDQVNRAKTRLDCVPLIIKRFRQAVLTAACGEGQEVELGDLLESVRYGTAVKCSPTAKGTPVLRIPNVVRGVVDHTDMKYGSLTEREERSLNLEPGDLLMIRSNGSVGLVGKVALVTERERECSYAGYLMRLRPKRDGIVPEYLHLALQTYDIRVQIEMPARSTSGVHNINSEEVKALRIHLPSPHDQHAAVCRVRRLLGLADAILGHVHVATLRASTLPHAILSKAFSGELVPTEAELARAEGRTYETAAEMLARLQSPSTAPAQRKRPRGRPTAGELDGLQELR